MSKEALRSWDLILLRRWVWWSLLKSVQYVRYAELTCATMFVHAPADSGCALRWFIRLCVCVCIWTVVGLLHFHSFFLFCSYLFLNEYVCIVWTEEDLICLSLFRCVRHTHTHKTALETRVVVPASLFDRCLFASPGCCLCVWTEAWLLSASFRSVISFDTRCQVLLSYVACRSAAIGDQSEEF